MSGRLLAELEQIVRREKRAVRAAAAADRYAVTLRRVRAYLASRPAASANAVYGELGGRRQDVLRAVRETRRQFPLAGNQRIGGGV